MNQQSLQRAFFHAFRGLFHFFYTDRNGKIQASVAVLVTVAGFILHVTPVEWCVLLLCMAIVIGLEMVNHAVEKLCDAAHPDFHPLIKTTKDVAAAAVLWAAIISAATGMIIFIPRLIVLLCH